MKEPVDKASSGREVFGWWLADDQCLEAPRSGTRQVWQRRAATASASGSRPAGASSLLLGRMFMASAQLADDDGGRKRQASLSEGVRMGDYWPVKL